MIKSLYFWFKNHPQPVLFSLLGIIFLGIPLLKNVQLESAAAVSLLASLAQINAQTTRKPWLNRSLIYPYFTFFPLLISDLVSGCFSADGFAFVLFLPVTSVLLSQQITRLSFKLSPFPLTTSALVLVWLILGLPLLEFFRSPVVYFYNPIWGYWPGPIYDEQIQFPPQFLFYRFYIVIWAFLLYELQQNQPDYKRIALIFSTLMVMFLNFRSLGVMRTSTELGAALNQVKSLENLTIHYHQPGLDSLTAEAFLREAVFHWQDLQQELGINDNRDVQIFIYNHAWHKKELTGAKFTQYTPVWLSDHQVHVDAQSFRSVIRHELVHVLAKNWSNSIINANWNIGLVEGLATAFDPDVATDYTLQEFVAAGGIPSQEEMQTLFSFWGFYSYSSTNAYYKTGAFIQFLAQTGHGSLFRDLYHDTKPKPSLDSLIFHWQRFLAEIKPDSQAQKEAQIAFESPSLFQKKCPRKISSGYQLYDAYEQALAENDSSKAQAILLQGLTEQDSVWKDWFRYMYAIHLLESGMPDSVLSLWEKPVSTRSKMVLLDAHLLLNNQAEALQIQKDLDTLISPENHFWALRSDSLRNQFFDLIYRKNPTNALDVVFSGFHPYLIETISQTTNSDYERILHHKLMEEPLDFSWLRFYLNWAYHLWKIGAEKDALQFLFKLELLSEKPQHRYLIQREIRLVNFKR